MALPKIEHPTFKVTLPSSKSLITLRPFLVREEKILLMALQSEDSEEVINSIKQVINNCIFEENINVDDLATIDIEYLFIKLRARSVNNIIKLTYKDNEDEKRYDVEVNLDEVEVKYSDEHTNDIKINEEIGIKLKYPNASLSNQVKDAKTETELFFKILKNSLDVIYDKNNEYKVSDSSEEEVEEFIHSLDVKAFNKIQSFFTTMPRLHYEVSYVNSLGKNRTITLNSLSDFFTLG